MQEYRHRIRLSDGFDRWNLSIGIVDMCPSAPHNRRAERVYPSSGIDAHIEREITQVVVLRFAFQPYVLLTLLWMSWRIASALTPEPVVRVWEQVWERLVLMVAPSVRVGAQSQTRARLNLDLLIKPGNVFPAERKQKDRFLSAAHPLRSDGFVQIPHLWLIPRPWYVQKPSPEPV